jgi:hypothetical protein
MEENKNYFTSLDGNFFEINNTIKKEVFTLLYCNIRSMRQNFNNFLVEFSQLQKSVTLIVLSEVWINSDELNLYKIPDYKMFAQCNNTYRAGGVICYVLDSVCVTETNVTSMRTADTLLLDIKINKHYFKLFCIYRIQHFSEKDFITELETYIDHFTCNTIMLGDINIDLLDGKNNSRLYSNLMENNGFQAIVNKATRITDKSKTLIDHIFIKHRQLNNFKSAIFDVNITDHCLLGLKFFENGIHSNNNVKISSKQHLDINRVSDCLKLTNWNDIFMSNDVNFCYERFHETLTNVINNCSKTIQVNKKLAKAKVISPWITPGILRKINKRKKLYLLSKRRPYDVALNSYYDSFYNRLKIEIDSVKKQYYSNLIRSVDGDSSKQWEIINSLTGEQRNQSLDKVELEDGTVDCDPQSVADRVNRYLVNIVQPDSNIPTQTELGIHHHCNSFFIEPTNDVEIISTISSLKNKKSSGFDRFNVYLVKNIAQQIAPVLTHIFNLSFSQGIFPNILKLSIVIPIFKKAKSIQITNIRPISLISIFSKVIEKIMVKRVVKYLEKIKFLSQNQYGFQRGKSTEDALLNFTNMIYSCLNDGKRTTGLFVDFTKAFDLVNHPILLYKLEAAGIRGVALRWFRSFLSGREQRVRVGDCLSAPLAVTVGVPQGSVTSAILFLIFINDLLITNFNGHIQAFADDIGFIYSHKDTEILKTMLEEDLKALEVWCNKNKMKVNVSKTKYINFDFRGFDFVSPISYHQQQCQGRPCSCEKIEKVNDFKYLGVTFDFKFTWEKHIQLLHSKIKQSIRKFYFLRNFCEEALLKSLYYALINSRLQYGIICWGGTFKTLINKLRVTQNHFLRIILKKRLRESSFPLYRQQKILPIQNLFVFKVLRVFFLQSGNKGTENLYYATRRTEKISFKTPKVNKEIFKHSFSFLGPFIFNKLPLDIKKCSSHKLFCMKVKDWLLQIEDTCTLRRVLQ